MIEATRVKAVLREIKTATGVRDSDTFKGTFFILMTSNKRTISRLLTSNDSLRYQSDNELIKSVPYSLYLHESEGSLKEPMLICYIISANYNNQSVGCCVRSKNITFK